MKTVREVTFEILRHHDIDTVFGNPGSNELPFLKNLPKDFRYILALHEGVAVAMADGFAQATGRPSFVNLHAAAGTGNGMGGLANAFAAHTPMVVLAGQQIREMCGLNPNLYNIDATTLPKPLVKFSGEPLLSADVPRMINEALLMARLPPSGPTFLSVPWDDWDKPAGPADELLFERTVSGTTVPTEQALNDLADQLAKARNPALVFGPEVDVPGGFQAGVRIAETLGAPVWVAPSAPRCPFPTTHPCYRGMLRSGIGAISKALEGSDLIFVAGAQVFRYHQWIPGRYLPEGARLIALTSDPAEAARAPMGSALLGSIAATLEALAPRIPKVNRSLPTPRVVQPIDRAPAGCVSGAEVMEVVGAVAPENAIFVQEATSTVYETWEHLPMRGPQSLYFPAGGGLGFGLPAALGVQLAEPHRRVIAMIGDGASNYAITGLWTAAHYKIPVIFLVLNNSTYGALRQFTQWMQAEDVPGLDLPGIDYCKIAEGYGLRSRRVDSAKALRAALTEALAMSTPILIEVALR